MPTALVADVLRARRFRVVDLGASVPVSSFAESAAGAPNVVAVGFAITMPRTQSLLRKHVRAIRSATDAPVAFGGRGISAEGARSAGANLWTAHAADFVAEVEQLADAARGVRRRER